MRHLAVQGYSIAVASWVDDEGNIDTNANFRPCTVDHYLLHSLMLNNKPKKHVFAYAVWPKQITENVGLLHLVTAWDEDRTIARSTASFIPVQRILSKSACAGDKLDGITCLVACNTD